MVLASFIVLLFRAVDLIESRLTKPRCSGDTCVALRVTNVTAFPLSSGRFAGEACFTNTRQPERGARIESGWRLLIFAEPALWRLSQLRSKDACCRHPR